ncbi:MAG: tRNA pseudouridine(38-40) synthase TruA [Parachlamydiales bacterium]|nr:tRNA pseudouridine(38-40) synthase TruA [Parachlamydiales bacterium]
MYKVLISYDGTHYFGWQKTITGPSIQEELEKAIHRLTHETVLPEAASRTDRGVHAEGQVVQFRLEHEWAPAKLQLGLNAVLPKDIRIKAIERKEFHPTLDATGKEYHYRICQGLAQDPTLRLYSWHLRYTLDRKKIEQAAKHLIGAHDFTAFANEEEKDPVCTLESIEFDGIFRIRGNRFLYKMVRNLVGTLVYVGCGKISPETIPEILASKDRTRAGITAPAHGLYLHQVQYGLK